MNQGTTSETYFEYPDDSLLLGMDLLFDPIAVGKLLESSVVENNLTLTKCEVEYVRYKSSTNCIVTYIATWTATSQTEEITSRHFGKCYLVEDYKLARTKIKSHDIVKPLYFEPLIFVEEKSTIIYHFQYDRELKSFKTIVNPRKLNRILHENIQDYPRTEWRISDKKIRVSVIRFKPEKRAVVRVSTKVTHKQSRLRENLTLYLRCYCDNRGYELYKLMKRLYEKMLVNDNMPQVARPHAYLDDINMLIMAEVPGEGLLPLLKSTEVSDNLAQVAKSLANLHKIEGVILPERSADEIIKEAATTANSLSYLLPEFKSDIKNNIEVLKSYQTIFDQGVKKFVHGDFYYDQILVDQNRVAILDFERSYLGDPLVDLANFSAHLYLLELFGDINESKVQEEIFIKAYELCSGLNVDRKSLKVWKAYCLTQLSVTPFRRMKHDWRTHSFAIIKECKDLLS